MVKMKITVNQIKSGRFSKRIKSLDEFLKDPMAKSEINKAKKNIKAKWKRDVAKTFNVRSSRGLSCDNMLSNALALETKGKNSVVIYVKPISRGAKQRGDSGGAVTNLTSILFRGSRASFGKYHPKWDSRVQTGMHPGTSPSPMRNMWKNFKEYSREQIVKKLQEGLRKVRESA